MDLLELPGDTLTHLFSFLDPKSLAHVSQACSQLKASANSEVVWQRKCQPWSKEVNFGQWRSGMQSFKALYRLLRDLDRLVGHWSAKEMAPKGGLLYVVWGRLSVVACRIQPQNIGPGFACLRLFEVVGCPDGSSIVNLLTGRDNIELRLPSILNLSASRDEFFLESLGPPDAVFPSRRPQDPPLFERGGQEGRANGGGPESAASEGESSADSAGSSDRDDSGTFVYGEGYLKWLSEEGGLVKKEERGLLTPQSSSPRGPLDLGQRALRTAPAGASTSLGTVEASASTPERRDNPGRVNGNPALTAEEARRQYLLRVHLRQQQLIRNLWLGNNPGLGQNNLGLAQNNLGLGQQQEGQQLEAGANARGQGEMRRQAFEYLMRLANTQRSSTGQTAGRTVVPLSTYKRVSVPEAKQGQELAGLWSGVYGPHGREILLVTYTDDNRITATKLLGDPNVPCGEVSFQVKLDSARADPPAGEVVTNSLDIDWEEMERTIVKRYRGYGRVAGYGFRYPQWVSGQLLVERNGNFAFLWEDVNFIIRFQRVNVPQIVGAQLAKMPPSN